MLIYKDKKNISFLMNKQGKWSLAPAYDLTYSYDLQNKWLSAHQMTINNKRRDITFSDLLEAGMTMGLRKAKCEEIIDRVKNVVSNFEKYATEVKLKEGTFNTINKTLKELN